MSARQSFPLSSSLIYEIGSLVFAIRNRYSNHVIFTNSEFIIFEYVFMFSFITSLAKLLLRYVIFVLINWNQICEKRNLITSIIITFSMDFFFCTIFYFSSTMPINLSTRYTDFLQNEPTIFNTTLNIKFIVSSLSWFSISPA